jgi:hypothetical protein
MSDEVANLRQVLAQTQAVQRTQESARRRGEVEQQQRSRQIIDKVDIQGRQVEETPEAREKKVEPEGQGGETEEHRRRRKGTGQSSPEPAEPQTIRPVDPDEQDEGKGRMIDRTA